MKGTTQQRGVKLAATFSLITLQVIRMARDGTGRKPQQNIFSLLLRSRACEDSREARRLLSPHRTQPCRWDFPALSPPDDAEPVPHQHSRGGSALWRCFGAKQAEQTSLPALLSTPRVPLTHIWNTWSAFEVTYQNVSLSDLLAHPSFGRHNCKDDI